MTLTALADVATFRHHMGSILMRAGAATLAGFSLENESNGKPQVDQRQSVHRDTLRYPRGCQKIGARGNVEPKGSP